jgi:sodium-dependent dicarboxylate transporter 2/3/5
LLALRVAGERPGGIVAAFMGVTAALSMWVSNTATAIMMLPVAVSVIDLMESRAEAQGAAPEDLRQFALALLLGLAYSASIGGLATPIGTPPNLFLLSFLSETLGRPVSFVRWMAVALPLVLAFLPITWWMLTRVLHPTGLTRIEGSAQLVRESTAALGPLSRAERITLAVFVGAAGLWLTRPFLGALEVGGVRPFAGLTDAGVAMLAALVLFAAPVDWKAGRFVLDWETARRLPWGILILFGGGLSLAAAIQANGVAELLGAAVSSLHGLPGVVLVLGVVTGIVFLTELTSNTATAAALIPILAALAPGLGVDPILLIVPAALGASCAFMLPVATPPNAIVFGSGRVGIVEMSRAGFWLNWIGVALITGLTYALVVPLL